MDSGTTSNCNLVQLDTLRQLAMDMDILPCSHRLRSDGEIELPVCQMFNTAFKLKKTTVQDEVIVVLGTGEKIPTVCHGVGKLKGYQARFHVDVNVPPVAQRQHRIPYACVQAVDKKLEELLQVDRYVGSRFYFT